MWVLAIPLPFPSQPECDTLIPELQLSPPTLAQSPRAPVGSRSYSNNIRTALDT